MVKGVNRLIILSDFDGTLAPIAERPELVRIPDETKRILERLADNARCTLGIISGRSIRDVERYLKIKRIYYAGNHGLEVKGPRLIFTQPLTTSQRAALSESGEELKAVLRGVEGVVIEDKGLTISIHYRMVDENIVKTVEEAVVKVTLTHPSLKLSTGKKVFELRPDIDWNKGRCAELIVKAEGSGGLVLYLGDDETDEDAFRALSHGVTVLVNDHPSPTSARYFVKNTDEVALLLKKILEILS